MIDDSSQCSENQNFAEIMHSKSQAHKVAIVKKISIGNATREDAFYILTRNLSTSCQYHKTLQELI